MKDERDKIYDAVKAAEGAAHEVASEHGEGCEFGAMARHVERTMHGLAHQDRTRARMRRPGAGRDPRLPSELGNHLR